MTENKHDTFKPTAAEQVRWRSREHLLAMVRLLEGNAAIVQGETPWGTPTYEPAPLAGIRTAVLIRDIAAGRAKEFARTARGDGTTWAEIGEAFGLTRLAAEADLYLGEAAWLFLADGTLPRVECSGAWRNSVSWKCDTCGSLVSDTGPFGGHPADCETGHDEFCTRHRADIAAFRTWDEE